jgi:hypothetical protein
MSDYAICQVCDQSGYGIQFSMTPTGGYKFGEICTECEEAAEYRECPDGVCNGHGAHCIRSAEDARTERQVDALEDNGREYPKGYDGTGAW